MATLLCLPLVAFGTNQALAAAPRIILVFGSHGDPVVLDNWQENGAILAAVSNAVDAGAEDLGSRSAYRVAMYWGQPWIDYLAAGHDPARLTIQRADQLGRYYPATANHQAVFTFDSIPGPGALIRRLDPVGVRVFAAHGVGSSNSPPTPASPPASAPPSVAVAGLCVLMAIAGAAYLRRPRRQSVKEWPAAG